MATTVEPGPRMSERGDRSDWVKDPMYCNCTTIVVYVVVITVYKGFRTTEAQALVLPSGFVESSSSQGICLPHVASNIRNQK
jgi:hypothetical protein